MPRPILALLAVLLAPLPAAAAEAPHAFIELFTSQGCSSCPAADAFIGDLADRDDVLAVTMPVKLWDFLGWADTLATDELTKRQIAYSVARGDRDVFTPQLMVNGKESMLGSDRDGVLEWVRQHTQPLPLPIDLTLNAGVLTIAVGPGELEVEKATLWLMVVDEMVRVPVTEGENRGRRLSYHNVVRQMRPIGMWKGEAMSFDLPLADVEKAAGASCIVIAQVESFKGPGEVIGAARIDDIFPARTIDAALK